MPSQADHLYKAENNRRFAYAIRPVTPTATGWALTALFYSALHYVEAYNAKFNTHFRKHEDLNGDIARNPALSAIHDDYSDLSTFSWNARYQPTKYGASELEEAKEYQAVIEKHISDLLGI